jgi:DNA-binding Lrp family transcriptional regulator
VNRDWAQTYFVARIEKGKVQERDVIVSTPALLGIVLFSEVAQKIAQSPEVQEVHIITGDWDLLIKLRAENVDAIGKFVVDKLRLIKGLEKTLTCMVFETVKETTSLPQSPKRTEKKPVKP